MVRNYHDWAHKALGEEVIETDTLAETIYSSVYRLITARGDYILKQIPQVFYIEANILDRLGHGKAVHALPRLIARNDEDCAFITQSNGQKMLRAYLFENGQNIDLMRQGLGLYQSVQTSTAGEAEAFLKMGAADWRLDKLPDLYLELIQNNDLMALWGMDEAQRQALYDKYDDVCMLCDRLTGYNLPDTLNHCDLHNKNIVIDEGTKKLTIIDWAEVSVGNPILSVEPFFRSLRKHHNMTREHGHYIALQNDYLQQWNVPAAEGREILNVLGNIYCYA